MSTVSLLAVGSLTGPHVDGVTLQVVNGQSPVPAGQQSHMTLDKSGYSLHLSGICHHSKLPPAGADTAAAAGNGAACGVTGCCSDGLKCFLIACLCQPSTDSTKKEGIVG